jgi:hypothetical protein
VWSCVADALLVRREEEGSFGSVSIPFVRRCTLWSADRQDLIQI